MGSHVQSLAEHDSKIGHRYVVKPCVSFIAFIMLNCYSVTDFILAGDFGTVNFFAFCSDHQDPSIVCWKAILIMHFDAHNVLRFGFLCYSISLSYSLSTTLYKEPFRVPVDWKGMGLFDYPTLIKKPMDLGTVKKNISARKYKTIPEAAGMFIMLFPLKSFCCAVQK